MCVIVKYHYVASATPESYYSLETKGLVLQMHVLPGSMKDSPAESLKSADILLGNAYNSTLVKRVSSRSSGNIMTQLTPRSYIFNPFLYAPFSHTLASFL